jgi:hypothetical protein
MAVIVSLLEDEHLQCGVFGERRGPVEYHDGGHDVVDAARTLAVGFGDPGGPGGLP